MPAELETFTADELADELCRRFGCIVIAAERPGRSAGVSEYVWRSKGTPHALLGLVELLKGKTWGVVHQRMAAGTKEDPTLRRRPRKRKGDSDADGSAE